MKERPVFSRTAWLSPLLLLVALHSAQAIAATRVAAIQLRGTLNCGVWPLVAGFAIERDGNYSGFDIDICRAVAAAILGDAKKVRFLALGSIEQLDERHDIDLAVRRLTWTLAREETDHVAFGPVTFYDGQGFMVPRASAIKSAAQLMSERVCVINLEHQPEALYQFFHDNGGAIQAVLVHNDAEADAAMRDHRCIAYSADISWLAAARAGLAGGLTRYEILQDRISKEPLAPLVRAGDAELLELVRWTIYSLIEAEELGLNSHNIIDRGPLSAAARSFLLIHPGIQVALGPGEWSRAIIASVGNYGELYDRNLGRDSPIKLERGLNRLWSRGGLLYAPPLDR